MSSINLITLPIGNKNDITLRALAALKKFHSFYAEDTRVFKELLKELEIDFSNKEIDSFHDHSKEKIEKIIAKVKSGIEVAIVSDAGSPIISDPAYPLINEAIKNDIEIKTYPGVTSVITALELSGLPSNPFHFWGFIGRSDADRKNFFKELNSIRGTHIFFESPHRILDTVKIFFEVEESGELVVTRELTKTYETVARIKKDDLVNLEKIITNKGEFVVLFHVDKNSVKKLDDDLILEVENFINDGGNTKKLAKIFAKILDKDTKEIYSKLTQSK